MTPVWEVANSTIRGVGGVLLGYITNVPCTSLIAKDAATMKPPPPIPLAMALTTLQHKSLATTSSKAHTPYSDLIENP